MRIYCFQVDFNRPLTPAKSTGRIGFLSSPWIPTGGLAGADAKCTSDTQGIAALNGKTFQALLATTTASAVSRFDTTGAMWVRTDGIPIVNHAADITSRHLAASISVMANGTDYSGSTIWAGAPDLTSLGTTDTCTNWTSSTGNGASAFASSTRDDFFNSGYTTRCNQSQRIYCLEP